MKNWPLARLGDAATVKSGAGFPLDKQGLQDQPIPFFKVGDMNTPGNESEMRTFRHSITEQTREELGAALLPAGSVVFPKVGAAIGTNKKRILICPSCVDNNVMAILPGEKLTTGFLFALLATKDLMEFASNSNPPSIRKTTVEDWQIPVPPLAEQERISKLLNEADELLKLRAQGDRSTAALIPALFHEMFGDPEHTPLPVKPLVELVVAERPITYGILKPGPDIEDGIPYVRVLDIKQSRLHVEQLHKTTKEIANQYRRSTLCPGDILVTIRGAVGRTCIVPDELAGANITQDTARLATIANIQSVYVVEFINTPWAQNWMNHHTQGQAVKGINLGDLKKLPVPVPPLALQKEFAARVTKIRELEANQATSRRRLDDLFHSMLSQAFNGQL